MSGGKDSTYMLASLVERWGRERIVAHHQVLPLQWPGTVDYCRQVCDVLGVEWVAEQGVYEAFRRSTGLVGMRRRGTVRVYSDGEVLQPWDGAEGVAVGPLSYALARGFPISLRYKWCMTLFKRRTLDDFIRRHRSTLGGKVLVALGSRRLEGWKRARLSEVRPRLDMSTKTRGQVWDWKPILGASRRDCFAGVLGRGLPVHPAYRWQGMTEADMLRDEEGGPRIGCRFCIYATDEEVLLQARMAMNRRLCQRILDFEARTGYAWRVLKAVSAVVGRGDIGY